MKTTILFICLFAILPYSLFAVKIERDINYASSDKGLLNQLDIYFPAVKGEPKDVLIFIHGGSWRSGDKHDYWWMGRNFARKDIVTVMINYPLSPKSQYDEMAQDCAKAVKWVTENITKYGGNNKRIFLLGHSAGGHLAALITQNPSYFNQCNIQNPVKGVILNDAFGIDMYQYLNLDKNGDQVPGFLQTFTTDPEIWKKGSPMYYTSTLQTPYILFYGQKTYPAIRLQSLDFNKKLLLNNKSYGIIEIKNKKHIGMITQMILGYNKLYGYCLDFMKKVK